MPIPTKNLLSPDTAETLKILPTGYNMATEKIDFVKL